ncbi:MAG: 2-oxoacid:acceptor oxidoreductase family protein [Syntrophaceticus schinkii]|nr:2-oxoacid:acceptor oxidoreductase family protein [Syntrophaceticus schinkii]
MQELIQIKIYGLGGQGVVTAGKILTSAAAIHEDKYAMTVPAYGHERRGAPVFADLVVDEAPILTKCFVYEPDYVLIFDLSVIEKGINVVEGAHENTCFVVNSQNAPKDYPFSKGFGSVYYVDATTIANQVLKINVPNSAIAGAFAVTKVVGVDAVCSALKEVFGERAGELNAEAARQSFQAVRQL